jgi:hypothetical protein
MTWNLESVWTRREILRDAMQRKMAATEPMPVHVMVWFNVMLAQIIIRWNEGGEDACVVSNKELLAKVVKAFKTEVSPDQWRKALNTLCLADIHGPMNFLLFTDDDEHYLVNYPWIRDYLGSDTGKGWLPALQMLYGINVGALRQPEAGRESDWVSWLAMNMKGGDAARAILNPIESARADRAAVPLSEPQTGGRFSAFLRRIFRR